MAGLYRTTPILVGGTLLVVTVTGVVIFRMAALDAEMARSKAPPPIVSAVMPTAITPPPTVPEALPEAPPEPPEAAAPPAPATVAIPEPAMVAVPPAVLPPAEAPHPVEAKAAVPVAAPRPTAPPAPWWPAPTPDALNLVHAGYLGDYPAIVLLFDGEFQSTDGIDQAITVTRFDGSKAKGAWKIGPNGRALILAVPPGDYRVDIAPILVDTKGHAVATAMGGPVLVR